VGVITPTGCKEITAATPSHLHCKSAATTTTTTLHPFNSFSSRTTWVSRYQKCKTSLYLNEARDDRVWDTVASAGPMLTICTSLQIDNHTNTSSLNLYIGRMLFVTSSQQCQRTEDMCVHLTVRKCHSHATHSHRPRTDLSVAPAVMVNVIQRSVTAAHGMVTVPSCTCGGGSRYIYIILRRRRALVSHRSHVAARPASRLDRNWK